MNVSLSDIQYLGNQCNLFPFLGDINKDKK